MSGSIGNKTAGNAGAAADHHTRLKMRLCRYGLSGSEKPGLIDDAGMIRDLSTIIPDVTVDMLDKIGGIEVRSLPVVTGEPRLGVPVAGIGKIVAIGLNYRDHALESNLPIPSEPVMFMKAVTSLNGPNDNVMLPRGSRHSDWEVELGVVIGRTCRYVPHDRALQHVAGYVLVNDVSERFNQKERGSQWSKGKGHDTFCPVGPWLVTPDEVVDPQNLDMSLFLNGKKMQTGNTQTMIFDVPTLISYVSEYVTLLPGDLLITGTPPGVGEGKKPEKIFLAAGDRMTLSIDRLGSQRQTVVPFSIGDVG